MTPSTALFDLIHTLQQSEKRYFRRFATRHVINDENNYLQLFDSVAKQRAYDEAAIKAQFAGSKMVQHFPSVKNYLYKTILQAMRAYHREKNARRQLQDNLHDVSFLRDKRLYAQCRKALAKIIKAAGQLGHYDILAKALRFERSLIFQTENAALAEKISANMAQTEAAESAHNCITAYHDLSDKIFLLARTNFNLQRANARQELEALQKHPLVIQPPSPLPFRAKAAYLSIRSNLAQLSGDAAATWAARYSHVQHWQEHPKQIPQDLGAYVIALSNYLSACHLADHYDDFLQTVDTFKKLPADSRDLEAEIFQNAYYYELLYRMNHGQFTEGAALVPDIEAGLERYQGKVNPARILAFHYNIAILYFVAENFRESLRWINEIVNHERSQHRQDIQQVARILLLILHFELRNFDLLEYLLRSTVRYLKKNDSQGRFEQFVIEYMRKFLKEFGKLSDMAGVFSEMEAALLNIQADTAEQHAPGINELRLWLTAKVRKVPIAEIFRKIHLKNKSDPPDKSGNL